MILTPGTSSYSIDVQILDDAGLAVTGLVASTFPAVSYSLGSNVAATSITLSDLAAITTAFTSGGLKERSGGWYRLDLPNAALSSAGTVTLIGEATGKHLIAPKIQVQKTAATLATGDIADISATRAAKIDNLDATVTSRMATFTLPTNFSSFSIDASGRVDIGKTLGTAVTLDANNVLNVSVKYLAGQVVTATAGFSFDAERTMQTTVANNLDAAITSRLAPSVSGRALIVDTSGRATSNLQAIGGTAISTGSGRGLVNLDNDYYATTTFACKVQLDASQTAWAPAKAGDKMDLINAPNATGIGAIVSAVWAATTRSLDATSITSLVTSITAGVWGAATRTLTAFSFTATLPTTPPAGYGGFAFTGARPVTITVYLPGGTTPAPSAVVRVTQGNSTQSLQSDINGQLTLSLDDGNYTLSITKGSAYSFTPATITVDANHTTFAATLVANTYTPATDPTQSRCYLVCYDPQGNPDPAAKVTIQLAAPGASGAWTNNLMVVGCDATGTIVDPADGNAGVRHALGIAYKARRGDGAIFPETRWVTYTPNAPVFQMPAMIGRDPASAACFGQG